VDPFYKRTSKELLAHIEYFENPDNFDLSDEDFRRLMRVNPSTVHLHTSPLAYKVIRCFQRHGITDIPVMLTSHTPESNGKEMADLFRGEGFDNRLTARLESAVRLVEALAFRAADIWIFPSPEAMEPYLATIPCFENWLRGKDVRFVATGALPPRTSMDSKLAKSRLDVAGRKVVSFIGRHNTVKGYDIFCEAAKTILGMRPDIYILVAGARNSSMPTPKHARWRELGWYPTPGDILSASDVFVLPNRMTYFDLVLIEALAMKTITVASATGGNKSINEMTGGALSLFDGSSDDLVAKVLEALTDEPPTNKRRGLLSEAYETHFTPEKFAIRYRDVVRQVHQDYLS
jgi:glycosyltransferase involved in cell wall biosynthesis